MNVARLLGVDPESALKGANRKFRRRFRHIEDRLREAGRTPADSNLEEMDALWNEAKAAERGRASRDSTSRSQARMSAISSAETLWGIG